MIDHIFLFVYIVSVGLTFSVTALSLLYWLRKPNAGRFNTFLFIAYLTLMLLLAGVRFYWEELLGGGRAVAVGTGMAEFAGYALILYYLPATVNHIIGRRWTNLKKAAAVTASAVYFGLGAAYLLTGNLKPMSLAAAFLYVVALTVILADILRSIPLIKRASTRVTVLSVTLLTVVFLPLVLVGRFMGELGLPWEVSHSLRFLFLSLYHFWMALAGDVFYVREMSRPSDAAAAPPPIPDNLPLTDRERGIAESLAKGLTYGEIAENLGNLRESKHEKTRFVCGVGRRGGSCLQRAGDGGLETDEADPDYRAVGGRRLHRPVGPHLGR